MMSILASLGWHVAICHMSPFTAAEVSGNLVTDGGMEEWGATGPEGGPFGWNYLAVQWKSAEFARDGQGRILTPAITDQFYDTQVVKPETQDVHAGQKALRLKGQLYLRHPIPLALNQNKGPYLVRVTEVISGFTQEVPFDVQ